MLRVYIAAAIANSSSQVVLAYCAEHAAQSCVPELVKTRQTDTHAALKLPATQAPILQLSVRSLSANGAYISSLLTCDLQFAA